MATFPGTPPNPLGVKVELNLAGTWTDITQYVQHRSDLQITSMGRADESSSISTCQLTLPLKNDGRFTPKNSAGAYYPNIIRNTQVRVSVSATSQATVPLALNLNTGFETDASNWTAANSATIARSTSQAHTGTASLSLHGNGTVASPQAGSEKEPVTASTSYTATAWYFNTAVWASGCGTQINWYDSGSNFISSSFTFPGSLAANTWTQISVTATSPSNAAYANVNAIISGTPAVGNIFFVDDAALTSLGGVAYSGSRFYGEISAWPPASDISGRDTYVTITASGIWRRISQAQTTIGSAYTRYVGQLTGANVPQAYWAMEDGASVPGAGTFSFVPLIGANSASTTGTLSLSADGTSFPGSDALPQFNQARITANVPAGGTATNNVVRFALSVPAAGDSSASTFSGGGELAKILSPSATVKRYDISLVGNQLQLHGYTSTGGGTAVLSGTITTKVNGTPVLVSLEITPSGGSIAWALRIIKPGAGSVLDQVTGTRATSTIAAVTQVFLDGQGRLADSTFGQLGVWYAVPTLTTAASALSGFSGEFAVDRFNRLCGEFGIATEVIGSASAAMGPQVDDTLSNILQSIESTDGGLLYESRTQFGLGYRTLGSLQNQSPAAVLNYTGGQLGAPPAPTYDDQLLANQVTAVNYDGYTALAQLTSGALSIAAVPNGVGVYAPSQLTTNATSHSQVNAVAQQRMFIGTVDDVRYPQVVVNMARAQAASLFSLVPSLRIGDYFQLVNLPATLGGSSTSKQLAWGYAETISHNSWVITYNAIPELPFESTFSPGVYSVTQAPAAGVAQGSAVGSTVSASQIGAGAVLPGTISARGIGGMTSFISASTPYDWTFAVSGTPADATYFTATEDQTLPIAVGDTFVNTGGLGGPFTVTSVDPPSGGNVNVHFTPDASSVMSSGTVQGGKEGDTWVNTSGGNQVNIWHNGAWTPVTWTASSVLTASSITSGLIAAGTIIAGVVDGTTITGATLIATGSSGEILVYNGTPALGNLIGSWSGNNGTDALGNTFHTGLEVQIGGLVLDNQGSAPAGTSGASTFYSSVAGRPRYLSQAGADMVLDRSVVNVSQFTPSSGNTTAAQISAQLSYLANEGNQSSEYEIEISGIITGPTAINGGSAPTLTFGLAVDGSVLGAQCTVGGVMWGTTGITVAYTIRFRMAVVTTGAGGTVIMSADGDLTRQGANSGNGPDTNLFSPIGADSGGTTKSFDTTSNHTIQVMSSWASTLETGHGITTFRTRLTRRM